LGEWEHWEGQSIGWRIRRVGASGARVGALGGWEHQKEWRIWEGGNIRGGGALGGWKNWVGGRIGWVGALRRWEHLES